MKHIYIASAWDSVVTPIKNSFVQMYAEIAGLIPNLIVACVILAVGCILAVIVKKVLEGALSKIKFDKILEKVGVTDVLEKVGMKSSAASLLAKVLMWIIVLFVVKNAAKELGVVDVEIMINNVIAFLPKVVIAGVILLFGFIIAEMVQSFARNGLQAMNLDYAKPLSNILFGFVFVIILTVALDQLGIQTELLNASVKIILASLGLAMAMALGLGLRNLAKGIVAGVYARDIYKPGTQIEIDGELARVAGVGPVTTKLQTNDGGFIMLPNAELVETRVKGQSAE